MSKLPLVIVNPASAGGATQSAWPRLASDLRTHFGPFACAFTQTSGDAIRLAEEGARAGRALIIACGGDGTVSEVANGILRSGGETALGILPSGTGGDFRRTLKISKRTPAAAAILRDGKTRVIDVGRAIFQNSEGEEVERYFLGVASFGMSAEIIARVKEDGKSFLPKRSANVLGGKASFALATVRATLAAPRRRVKVKLDASPQRHITVAQICVANARYFGGGMNIAPDALLDDGKFDVIVIGDLGAARILATGYKLYLGTHTSLEQVHCIRTSRLTVSPANKDENIAIEIDGELLGHLPAEFQILPRALKVRCA